MKERLKRTGRSLMAYGAAAVFVLRPVSCWATTMTGTGTLPWDQTLTSLQTDLSGPVAHALVVSCPLSGRASSTRLRAATAQALAGWPRRDSEARLRCARCNSTHELPLSLLAGAVLTRGATNMQRRTSPFGYLAIVAAVTTAATVFLTVIGRIPYWLPI